MFDFVRQNLPWFCVVWLFLGTLVVLFAAGARRARPRLVNPPQPKRIAPVLPLGAWPPPPPSKAKPLGHEPSLLAGDRVAEGLVKVFGPLCVRELDRRQAIEAGAENGMGC